MAWSRSNILDWFSLFALSSSSSNAAHCNVTSSMAANNSSRCPKKEWTKKWMSVSKYSCHPRHSELNQICITITTHNKLTSSCPCSTKHCISSLNLRKLITALNCLLNLLLCGACKSLKPKSALPQIVMSLDSRQKNLISGMAST